MAFNTKISLTNDKVCQADAGVLTLCGDTSIDAVGTLKYSTDQNSAFVARSIVDAGYVTGKTNAIATRVTTIEGKYLSGATNGLNYVGKQVRLGGNITGATTITLNNGTSLTFTDSNSTPSGIKYGGDYTNFTARSLVDAQWVTGRTSTSGIQTANNGLCKRGTVVSLGGSLTGATTIGSGTPQPLTICSSALLECSTGTVGICATGIVTLASGVASGLVIAAPTTGAVYNADYSAGFINESLVTKRYVTGLTTTSGIQTASNGLTKTGTNITLGGLLAGNTNIDLNNNDFEVTGGTNEFGIRVTPSYVLLGETINGGNQNYLQVSPTTTEIYYDNTIYNSDYVQEADAILSTVTDVSGATTLSICSADIIISSTNPNFSGATYDAASAPTYRNQYRCNSLVDKAYVDAASGGIGAENGLTRLGNNITLGGTLTGDTSIDNSNKTFSISSGGTYGIFVNGCNAFNGGTIIASKRTGIWSMGNDLASECISIFTSDKNLNMNCEEFSVTTSRGSMFINKNEFCLIGGTGNTGVLYGSACAPVYRNNYLCNSLVDKAYVDGASGSISGSNGLTRVDDNITLGGQLTGNTTIDVNFHTFLICGAPNKKFIEITEPTLGEGRITIRSESGATLSSASNVCVTAPNVNMTGSQAINIDFNSIVLNNSTGNIGATYNVAAAPNYRSTYLCNSLVDAAYVTGLTTTADNGLTKTGTNVRLGGTLVTNTTVGTGTCTLTLNTSTLNLTGTSLVNINAPAGGLKLITAPSTGLNTDTILVRASDGTVKTISGGAALSAAITGATNGLTKSGQRAILGGALTGNTTISACKLYVTSGLYGSNVGYLTFSGATAVPTASGSLYYANNALNLQREFTGVVLQIGEETVVKVCNTSGSPIPNGTAVYISGANGGLPVISASIASNKAQAVGTIGLATMTIGATSQGYVTMLGTVHDLNTNAYAAGTILYLSSSVAGGLTSTAPAYPNEAMKLGTVTVQSATVGELLVDVHNLTEYVTKGQFTGYTATTASNLNLKLDKVTFNSYTGTTTPIINGLVTMCARAITGVTNGLTKTDCHNACLGGTLTAPTSISGTQLLTLGDLNGICLSTANTNDIALNAKSNGSIYLKSQSGTVASSSDHTTAVGIELDYNASVPMVVYDTTVGVCKGLQYAADYSTQYSDRSLVDKAYVNSVATGLNVHGAVAVTTTGSSITLSGNQTIDGILTTTGMRVLVKDQTTGWTNGIYSANTGTWGRTPDYNFNPSGEVTNGDLIPVLSGTTYANSQWVLTSPNPITSGVTSLVYSIFSQQQGITQGNGICVTTVGSNRNVAVRLSPSNAGLCFDATALELDYNIFRYGLTCTLTAGKVDVKTLYTSSVSGSEIPVSLNTGNTGCKLYVDSAAVVTALGTPITTANNGLNKVGSNVRLGGALTGSTTISGGGLYDLSLTNLNSFNLGFDSASTITDSGSNGGIKYAADYSGAYTDRSLIDKAYANSLITSGVLAANGLTKVGNTVILGGALTGNTNVNLGAAYLCFADGGSNTVALTSTCSRIQVANNVAFLSGCSGSNAATVCVTSAGILSLKSTVAAGSGIVVTAPVTGAIYAADYSGGYIARSLVDAAYVTGKTTTSGIQTANNGLNKVGTNVRLGGTLTGTTTINGAQTLNFNITNFNVTGTTNATGALNVSGAIDGNSTLDVLGATALRSTLNVTGVTTLSAKASYLTDLAPFTARQIPDAAWVTGKTSTSGIQTANNGLNKVGTNVRLGGALTGATVICGAGIALNLGCAGSVLGAFTVCSASVSMNPSGAMTLNAGTTVGICPTGILTLAPTAAAVNITPTGAVNITPVGAVLINPSTTVDICPTGALTFCSAGAITFNKVVNYNSQPTFTALSHVNAAWVTGITSTLGIQTANNGLNKVGLNVRLGGSLTGATTIGGGTPQPLSICTSTLLECTSSTLDLRATGALGVCSAGVISITTTAASQGVVITAPATGAVYAANYSTGYVARSLVDAAYVTGRTSQAILTANNGLTKVGTNVVLGGALTGATAISGNFALCLGTTATPLAAVNICGASLVECTSGAQSHYSTTSLTCASSTLDLRSTGAAGLCSAAVTTIIGSCVNITPVTDATIFAGNCVMACVGTATYGKVGANGTSATLLACGAVSTNSFITACNTGVAYVSGSDSVNISGGLTNGICLTGPVKVVTAPATGSVATDSVLVRATDGTVKTVATTALGDKNNLYAITAVTGNVTLADAGTQYVILVNGAAPVTITLPATPTAGRVYRIKDVSNAAVTNNITINRNGKNIDGSASDALINTSGGSIELVYSGDGAAPLSSWYTLSFVN